MKNVLVAPSPAGLCAVTSRHSAVAKHPADRAETVHLLRDDVIRLEASSTIASIEVESGLVWLTSTPANGDVLLRQGDQFALRDHWPFVIQALGGARLRLFKN